MTSNFKKVLAVVVSALLLVSMTCVAFAVMDDDTLDIAVAAVADEETTYGEETTAAEVEKDLYLLGDIDLNGIVKANDARLALRLAADLSINYDDQMDLRLFLADYNKNGSLKANDARFILRVAADLPVSFGFETFGEDGVTAIYTADECTGWYVEWPVAA